MLEKIFAFLREGRRNFLKKYMPFCQNESKMFCLIGDLLVSGKSLSLEPSLILEKCLIANSERPNGILWPLLNKLFKMGEDHPWTQQFKYLLTTSKFLWVFNFMWSNSESVESAEILLFHKSGCSILKYKKCAIFKN